MQITYLEKERRERGLTKVALAKAASVQPNVITWAEDGRFRPYDSQLQKLAIALGVEDASLLLNRIEV